MKRDLYSRLLEGIQIGIQQGLDEQQYNVDYNKFGNVKFDQVLKDTEKPLSYKDQKIGKDIQKVLDDMHKQYKFKEYLKDFADTVSWSPNTPTACTDMQGMLIFNPEFAKKIYDIGLKAVEFTIMHEAMHNYLKNKNRFKQTKKSYGSYSRVNNNIDADKEVNTEILRRWPEYKEYAEQLGAIM